MNSAHLTPTHCTRHASNAEYAGAVQRGGVSTHSDETPPEADGRTSPAVLSAALACEGGGPTTRGVPRGSEHSSSKHSGAAGAGDGGAAAC